MDVYTAEVQLEKILSYVEERVNDKPRMYNKSKHRWKGISEKCERIVHAVSVLIQDEILENSDESFEPSAQSDYQIVIQSMQRDIDALKQFMNYAGPPPPSAQSAPTLNLSSDAGKSKIKIPSSVRKSVMKRYVTTLSEMIKTSSGYIEVDEFIRLLYRWFECRFFKSDSSSVFKYNIRRIPSWVYSICIAFGKSLENGTAGQFCRDFHSWCDSITDDTKYAVPYEIYQLNTKMSATDMSLTAVVLWDILIDSGLSDLCDESDKYDLYLSDSALYDMCNTISQDTLDSYVNYAVDSSILSKVRIRRCNVAYGSSLNLSEDA